MKIIDVFICKLRKKLVQAGADNLIGTVWGRGYMVREPSADPMTMPGEVLAGVQVPGEAMLDEQMAETPMTDEAIELERSAA